MIFVILPLRLNVRFIQYVIVIKQGVHVTIIIETFIMSPPMIHSSTNTPLFESVLACT